MSETVVIGQGNGNSIEQPITLSQQARDLLAARADAKRAERNPAPKLDGLVVLKRMTPQERAALRTAAASDPQMADFMDEFFVAGEIDPASPDLAAAKAKVVASGAMTDARFDEVFKAT
jgi:hypothetical protein